MIPRIRGKVGTIVDPPEYRGKFAFSIWFSELRDEKIEQTNPDFGPIGPYDTEADAQKELMNACKIACETFEKKITGGVSGMYFDLKTKLLRRWDKLDIN